MALRRQKKKRTAPATPRAVASRARTQTDTSLRAERRRGEAEFKKAQGRTQAAADAQGASARERATTAIARARGTVDARLQAEALGPGARAALRRQRTEEDTVRRGEHRAADAQAQVTRRAQEAALGQLLLRERASTDRRLLTERLQADESLLARDTALAAVAHELRTLLFGVRAQAANLRSAAERHEPHGALAASAAAHEASLVQLGALVADLVDVAAIEMGKLALAPRPCDVGGLVEEARRAVVPVAAARGVTVEVEPLGEALRVLADPKRVLEVLANLLSNALKFTPAGGRIVLRAERDGTYVRFSVQDTGPGIARAHLESIFRRYWQADTPQREGLGLGHYLCRSIVAAHGGRIWAESVPGEGATLRFALPAC